LRKKRRKASWSRSARTLRAPLDRSRPAGGDPQPPGDTAPGTRTQAQEGTMTRTDTDPHADEQDPTPCICWDDPEDVHLFG